MSLFFTIFAISFHTFTLFLSSREKYDETGYEPWTAGLKEHENNQLSAITQRQFLISFE